MRYSGINSCLSYPTELWDGLFYSCRANIVNISSIISLVSLKVDGPVNIGILKFEIVWQRKHL